MFKPLPRSSRCLMMVLASVLMAGLLAMPADAVYEVGDTPQFKLKTMDGVAFTSKDLEGRIAILEFWATWCGPCIKQIPHLKELNEKYADKGVVLISISRDDGERKPKDFAEKNQMVWPQVHDKSQDRELAGQFGVRGIPHAVILSPDGQVLWKGHPARIDQPLAEALQKHPPRLESEAGDEADGGSPTEALAAVSAARRALAGAEPDYTTMLEQVATIDESMADNARVRPQLTLLLRQTARQVQRVAMTEARASNPEGAARLDALAAALDVPLDADDAEADGSAASRPAVHPRLAAMKLEKAEQARADEDHVEAYDHYAWLAERTPDSPQGNQAAEALAAYQGDEAMMQQIKTQCAQREAAALLRTAGEYANLDRHDLARKTWRQIVDQYPDTPAADKTRAALGD